MEARPFWHPTESSDVLRARRLLEKAKAQRKTKLIQEKATEREFVEAGRKKGGAATGKLATEIGERALANRANLRVASHGASVLLDARLAIIHRRPRLSSNLSVH